MNTIKTMITDKSELFTVIVSLLSFYSSKFPVIYGNTLNDYINNDVSEMQNVIYVGLDNPKDTIKDIKNIITCLLYIQNNLNQFEILLYMKGYINEEVPNDCTVIRKKQ